MLFRKTRRVFNRLDRIPKPWAIALGLPVGAGTAFVVLAWPAAYGAAAFLGLLALAGLIAWSGEAGSGQTQPKPDP
jgi:O-antigen/teichoic acid export membrane protein